MKRFLFVILTLILILSFASACQSTPSENNNDEPTTQPIVGETSDEEQKDEYVPDKDDDNSMFVYPNDPAKYVVDYMTKMSQIEWTPDETFHLHGTYQAWKYNLVYEKGKTYYGLPFLVGSRGTMQQFKGSLDENGVYIGGTTDSTCIGDACYDAVYVSLIQVCPSITFKSTEDMLPGNNTGLKAVGEWNPAFSKHDTPTIIQKHSTQEMAKSYAQLKPGDVVLKHVVVQDAGHARIVVSEPHIEYTPLNTIDIEKSYITTVEQTNLWDDTTSVNTTWWVNRKYAFGDLISTNFVPLRPVDYDKTPKAAYIATENLISADKIADAKRLNGKIFSNHYMTELEISITNSNGIEIYNNTSYPNSKTVHLDDIRFNPQLYKYDAGEYTFTINASLATGTKTVAELTFTIEE